MFVGRWLDAPIHSRDFFNRIGPKCLMTGEQSMSALPGRSDINLFRYAECVVYLDPEITDSALDLRVAEWARVIMHILLTH